jgi:hypothetical protein
MYAEDGQMKLSKIIIKRPYSVGKCISVHNVSFLCSDILEKKLEARYSLLQKREK